MIAQQTLGRIFIWLGVLAWAPYIYLLAIGQKVSVFPFLALHLTGLFSGIKLRSKPATTSVDDAVVQEGRTRRLISKIMIYLGVLAWVPYFYLTRGLGQDVEITPYLITHLTGVLGGVAVRISISLESFLLREDK